MSRTPTPHDHCLHRQWKVLSQHDAAGSWRSHGQANHRDNNLARVSTSVIGVPFHACIPNWCAIWCINFKLMCYLVHKFQIVVKFGAYILNNCTILCINSQLSNFYAQIRNWCEIQCLNFVIVWHIIWCTILCCCFCLLLQVFWEWSPGCQLRLCAQLWRSGPADLGRPPGERHCS